jgi:AraC-like DNA-binding protein
VAEVLRRRSHEDRPGLYLVKGVQPRPFALDFRSFGDVAVGRFTGFAEDLSASRDEADRVPAGVMVDIVTCGRYRLKQDGRDSEVRPGDAAVYFNRMPFETQGQDPLTTSSLMVPEPTLARHIGDVTRLAGLVLPREGVALRLLNGYLGSLRLDDASDDGAFRAMIGRHLVDLLVTAIREVDLPDAPATDSRAARLAMVKRMIEASAHVPTFNLQRVATRLGCGERAIQLLFEEAGSTFTGTLMEVRLTLARARLLDPAHDHLTIRAIAESAGFSNHEHFNRAFRRRFGETPGSIRRTSA